MYATRGLPGNDLLEYRGIGGLPQDYRYLLVSRPPCQHLCTLVRGKRLARRELSVRGERRGLLSRSLLIIDDPAPGYQYCCIC